MTGQPGRSESSTPTATAETTQALRSRRPPVHQSMADAARIGLIVVATASFVFLFAPPPRPELTGTFRLHYGGRLLLSLAGIAVCRTHTSDRVVIGVLWAMAAVLSASSAYLGILRGDYTSNALISIALCTGSAAIIPWGWRAHLVLVLIFMTGLLVDAAIIRGSLSHAIDTSILFTLVVCMGGAVYTAVSLDRARREIERRQREDEEAIASLTHQLEERVRQRTRELQKANEELAAANARLARINAELDQANTELNGFTYSVSHDIRGALRVIGGQSHMLAEEHAGALPPHGRQLAEGIRSGTIRVGQLVDALLALARVSRARLRSEPVDLEQLARTILAELAHSEPARRVEEVVEPGLAAEGDPSLLRVLLENLLSNAWKFTRPVAAARIEVGSTVEAGERVYFVRDNGTGFDMRYEGKLFRPFEKLHEPGEYEGTGIGLSTVKRVVTRHGGRVWAQSAPGRGATFHFTLPAGRGPL
ncbi:MAG TPA: ATP-binding protein [Candidatus Limnocylindrales bacterium]|nr:ATP-binding protein [Candidatus Limnocylindrales bacterium]